MCVCPRVGKRHKVDCGWSSLREFLSSSAGKPAVLIWLVSVCLREREREREIEKERKREREREKERKKERVIRNEKGAQKERERDKGREGCKKRQTR